MTAPFAMTILETHCRLSFPCLIYISRAPFSLNNDLTRATYVANLVTSPTLLQYKVYSLAMTTYPTSLLGLFYLDATISGVILNHYIACPFVNTYHIFTFQDVICGTRNNSSNKSIASPPSSDRFLSAYFSARKHPPPLISFGSFESNIH